MIIHCGKTYLLPLKELKDGEGYHRCIFLMGRGANFAAMPKEAVSFSFCEVVGFPVWLEDFSHANVFSRN